MKLQETKVIKGQIVVKTGLHIGGDTRSMEIGGMDNPIIRNPATNEPYIPGSSLKGKLRSLYELENGRYNKDGNCCDCGRKGCPSCTVFGSANKGNKNGDIESQRGPTRLIVRDAFLCKTDLECFKSGATIIEEKNENSLNRINASANPRPIERVVPGVRFDFEMVYRVYDAQDIGNLDEVVFHSMKVLEKDYLGGGGSRGSGKVEFVNVTLDGEFVDGFAKEEC